MIGSEEPLKSRVKTLLRSMHDAYRKTALSPNPDWLNPSSRSYKETVRAAWIIHGREMINNAAEREWPGCLPLNLSDSMTCETRRRMARIGAWYVEVAGENAEEMEQRWDDIKKEEVLSPLYLPKGI